jgi:hypothetical protein
MATPEPWTDLVAAADEATATLIAERNPARLYGLEAPAPATAA